MAHIALSTLPSPSSLSWRRDERLIPFCMCNLVSVGLRRRYFDGNVDLVTIWLITLPDRLKGAFHWWRRILVGAAIGWLISSVGGAFVLAFFFWELPLATSNLIGAAIVWSGVVLGALGGYVTRPRWWKKIEPYSLHR